MKYLSLIAIFAAFICATSIVEAGPYNPNEKSEGGGMLMKILGFVMKMWNGIKAAFASEGSFGSGFTSKQSVEGTVNNQFGLSSDTTGKAGGSVKGTHEGNVGMDIDW
ncbi:hypothetical protein SNEBB_009710 [Seison nebaliae]|nr:hypothetical protein SNEBB_009710 [Seison nebaliae]